MAQQLSPADAARMQMMQDLEIEMMSDLYNRMTQACHKKCVPPRYSEPDLGEWNIEEKANGFIWEFHLLNVHND